MRVCTVTLGPRTVPESRSPYRYAVLPPGCDRYRLRSPDGDRELRPTRHPAWFVYAHAEPATVEVTTEPD